MASTRNPLVQTIYTTLACSALASIITACDSGGKITSSEDTDSCGNAIAVAYDETIDGDISNDRNAPTLLSLGAGSNTVALNTGLGDLEYLTVFVGVCDTLDTLTLTSYESNDAIAFMAVQQGSSFTVSPDEASTRLPSLLGYSHFGNTVVNQDLLVLAGAADNAAGLVQPLAAGTYTFWLQQLGENSQYTLDFYVSRVEAE